MAYKREPFAAAIGNEDAMRQLVSGWPNQFSFSELEMFDGKSHRLHKSAQWQGRGHAIRRSEWHVSAFFGIATNGSHEDMTCDILWADAASEVRRERQRDSRKICGWLQNVSIQENGCFNLRLSATSGKCDLRLAIGVFQECPLNQSAVPDCYNRLLG
jgi:hypothetical protein